MRILVTADPEIPVPPKLYGGIERIIYGLAKGLEHKGHEVGLLANRSSEIDINNLFSWNADSSRGKINSAKNTYSLVSAVKRFNPRVVHSFSRLLYMFPLLPVNLKKVMSYQREPTRETVSNSLKISRGTLSFTGCSDYICEKGRSYGGSWKAVHNFVDTEKFTFRDKVEKDAPLVFLSRVEEIKGAHTAIKAALETGKNLEIAGNADFESRYWKEMIEPYLGKKGINYVGAVDDVQKNELLGNASAMIVPIEWNEPFGIVFIESLACGTPVISSPFGALPEIVQNGHNGFLCSSFEEICESVSKVNSIDRNNCRKTVDEKFSSNVIVDKYIELYESLF